MWNLYSFFTTRQVFNVARDSAGGPSTAYRSAL